MIIYEEILREFEKEKVNYVIVGGIASLLRKLKKTPSWLMSAISSCQ